VEVINSEYKIYDKNLNPTKKKIFLKSLVLKQDPEDGSCIFLDPTTNLCKIYGARPFQCKSWPMWYPLMTNEKELREAKEKCPGFQFNSGFISQSQILDSLETELKIECRFINKMRQYDENLEKVFRFLKNIDIKPDSSV
jgi:Fe-S-cluster containining protein